MATQADILCASCATNEEPQGGVMIERRATDCRHWTHGAHVYCRSCASGKGLCMQCGREIARPSATGTSGNTP